MKRWSLSRNSGTENQSPVKCPPSEADSAIDVSLVSGVTEEWKYEYLERNGSLSRTSRRECGKAWSGFRENKCAPSAARIFYFFLSNLEGDDSDFSVAV